MKKAQKQHEIDIDIDNNVVAEIVDNTSDLSAELAASGIDESLEAIDDASVEELDEQSVIAESSLAYYMRRIADSTPLSKEEEQELGKKIIMGDKAAFDKLVTANLKFVIKVAFKFRNSGLPMSDIINQGNLGLLEAAKRYDPDKNVKFISYAVWWIRQYIVQGIAEQAGTVRLPIKQAGNLFKINMAREQLNRENGSEPTTVELAEHLEMKTGDVEDILRVSKQSLSLDAQVNDGDSRTFIDYIESSDNAEDTILNKNIENVLDDMISELDTRERKIIDLRFGFKGNKTMTLEELGKEFGVSRERVRQLESRAIGKLRKKATSMGLQHYLTID